VAGELAASALFGHERGAFTGASARRVGAFRRAHRGTLFLDEVSALTPSVQAALLRVVEEGIVLPVGSDQPIRADVRLVAATCEPLETMVERGLFRRDLYQRLSTCILWIAPLRERRGDIAAIARHIVSSNDMGIAGIDDEALLVLGRCKFPGNVRELRNVLIQAALCTDHSIITAAAVSAALEQRRGVMRPRVAPPAAVQLLSESGGNVSEAARRAGIARSTFRGLLKRARA
jgi:DNA-binding NtrC family response regulator